MTQVKAVCMRIAVVILRILALPFRPLPLRRKVLIISKQADRPTTDIRLLCEALRGADVDVTVLTRCLKKTLPGGIRYGFHMIRQMYHLATSRVVVADGHCILLSLLPKKQGQQAVQIWHSLGAIKMFGYQCLDKAGGYRSDTAAVMNMYDHFDYAIAPSVRTAQHFSMAFDMDAARMQLLGLPRIDYLKAPGQEQRRMLLDRYPALNGKPAVLYVPTFRRNQEPEVQDFFAHFPYEKFALIVKKHWLDPADYSWTERLGAIVSRREDTLDLIRFADKVVTDYSGAAFEAAVLQKDLYFYIPDSAAYATEVGLNIDMRQEAVAPYVYEDAASLCSALAQPYDRAAVAAFRDKYLTVADENCTQKLTEFLCTLLDA